MLFRSDGLIDSHARSPATESMRPSAAPGCATILPVPTGHEPLAAPRFTSWSKTFSRSEPQPIRSPIIQDALGRPFLLRWCGDHRCPLRWMTTARQTLARQGFHGLCGGCGGKSRGLTPYGLKYFFYLPTRHPTPGKFRPSVRDIPQIPPQPPHSLFSFFITI